MKEPTIKTSNCMWCDNNNDKTYVKVRVHLPLIMPWRHTRAVQLQKYSFLSSVFDGGAGSTGRTVYSVGLRPLNCKDCGFESRQEGVMSVGFLWVLCVVRITSVGPADHSSRGVLPSAVCLSVIMKPWQWGGPGPQGAVQPVGGGEETGVSGQFHVLAAVFPVKKLPECWVNQNRSGSFGERKSLGLSGNRTTIPGSSSP